jgi:four helix bundle protein
MRNAECGIRNELKINERQDNMGITDLKQRTKLFALVVITLVDSLPRSRVAEVLGRQLLRSGTSAGANYRSACRARSAADFISKMGIVEEELDESIYWMELLVESGTISLKDASPLIKEADELLAIIVSSIRTARKNRTK